MSKKSIKKSSKTDWERINQMKDEDIDCSDIPPLDENFFANADIRFPSGKEQLTIRLDKDVLAWFKSQGKGYQTRINTILRSYMEAQTRKNSGVSV